MINVALSIGDAIDRHFAKIEMAKSIWCPHCGAEYRDDDHHLVSYYGEDPPLHVDCGECEKSFYVKEIVVRTFESRAVLEDFDE